MAEEIKKIVVVDTKQSLNSVKSLKDQVTQLSNEIDNLEIGSDNYNKKVTELTKAQTKLTAVQDSLKGRINNNIKAFDSITKVTGALAGGISAVSAAMTLFGVENEDVNKTMIKLQATIAIVQGIGGLKGLGEGIRDGVAAFRALTVAQSTATLATKGATVAMRGFKTALISTGVGALVVALGVLAAKLMDVGGSAKSASANVSYLMGLYNNENEQQIIDFQNKLKNAKTKDEAEKIYNEEKPKIFRIDEAEKKLINDNLKKTVKLNVSDITEKIRKTIIEGDINYVLESDGLDDDPIIKAKHAIKEGMDNAVERYGGAERYGYHTEEDKKNLFLKNFINSYTNPSGEGVLSAPYAEKDAPTYEALRQTISKFLPIGLEGQTTDLIKTDTKGNFIYTSQDIGNFLENYPYNDSFTPKFKTSMYNVKKAMETQEALAASRGIVDDIYKTEEENRKKQEEENRKKAQQQRTAMVNDFGSFSAEQLSGVSSIERDTILLGFDDTASGKYNKNVAQAFWKKEDDIKNQADALKSLGKEYGKSSTQYKQAQAALQQYITAREEFFNKQKEGFLLEYNNDIQTDDINDFNNKINSIDKKIASKSDLYSTGQQSRSKYVSSDYDKYVNMGTAYSIDNNESQNRRMNFYQGEYDAQVNYLDSINSLYNEEIALYQGMIDAKMDTDGKYAEEVKRLNKEIVSNESEKTDALIHYNAQLQQDEIETLARKVNITTQSLNATSNLISGVSNIYKQLSEDEKKTDEQRKEYFKTYKALAISQAIINTASASMQAWNGAMSLGPIAGPIVGGVLVASTIAMGTANVMSIKNESMPNGANAASVTPQSVGMNNVSYTRNVLTDEEEDKINQPVKVYVLESDITTAQKKVEVRSKNTTF